MQPVIVDLGCLHFLIVSVYTFKKVENNNLAIINFLINCGKLIDWKRLGSRIQPSKLCTFFLKNIAHDYIY